MTTSLSRLNVLSALAAALIVPAGGAEEFTPGQIEFFELRIRPVLADHCYRCHGPEKQMSGLRLDSREAAMRGGDYGPVLAAGDPAGSRLLKAVRHEPGVEPMPHKADPLPQDAIAALEEWVRQGMPWPAGSGTEASPAADWRNHWAFQPVVMPPLPPCADDPFVRQPLDAFVLHRLRGNGLSPSPPADRATLMRRAAIALTGLMPDHDAIRAFEQDPDPDAFARLVDSLLASPHFGERWARHWMDIARYADTKGYVFQEERRYAFAWTYRDWLIEAFNRDVPYDRFLILQIAADQVVDPKANPRDLAAMGFLTLGRRFLNNQHDIIDDRLDVIFRGTQALTVGCARCHDHKFDPIPIADYYSLYGVLASSEEPQEKPLIGEPENSPEAIAYQEELGKLRAEVENYRRGRCEALLGAPELERFLLALPELPDPDTDGFRQAARDRDLNAAMLRQLARWIRDAGGSDPVFAVWHRLRAIPAENFAQQAAEVLASEDLGTISHPVVLGRFRESPPASMADVAKVYAHLLAEAPSAGPEQEAIAAVLTSENGLRSVPEDEIVRAFNRAEREHLKQLEAKVEQFMATSPAAPPRAMVLVDREKPVEPVIFIRGNPGRRGPEVPRQMPEVLSLAKPRRPFTTGSGRLELARELASPQNPLTARVFVNGVWARLFGAPLVSTPGDFGVRTPPPDNPQLLDALAAQFMNDGWSIKRLLRSILLSSTWQQTSLSNPKGREIDPGNRMFWRQNRTRLEFESMRDNLLLAAGNLDRRIGGRSVDILSEPFNTRRSLYGFVDRQNFPGLFRTFDRASPDNTTPLRYQTTVPQQALFFLNSPFVLQQARRLADAVTAGGCSAPSAVVRELFHRVLRRDPDGAEVESAIRMVNELAASPHQTGSRWENGYGRLADDGQSAGFEPLPVWAAGRWSGGESLPDERLGWVHLTPAGGHPGDAGHAAIRRWTAPSEATISIEGTVRVPSAESRGVRAVILTSSGAAGDWTVPGGGAVEARVDGIVVRPGDRILFVADCAGDPHFDSFEWAPQIRDAATGRVIASASGDFGGPGVTPWQALAQVLLSSNEFFFVD